MASGIPDADTKFSKGRLYGFSKVEQPPSFKDHAYREIKRAIIQHDIAPGSTIHERTLSESLGISRTPLKLALQQLEMEGWVQSLPRKGFQ